jgi:hypothetical protein
MFGKPTSAVVPQPGTGDIFCFSFAQQARILGAECDLKLKTRLIDNDERRPEMSELRMELSKADWRDRGFVRWPR